MKLPPVAPQTGALPQASPAREHNGAVQPPAQRRAGPTDAAGWKSGSGVALTHHMEQRLAQIRSGGQGKAEIAAAIETLSAHCAAELADMGRAAAACARAVQRLDAKADQINARLSALPDTGQDHPELRHALAIVQKDRDAAAQGEIRIDKKRADLRATADRVLPALADLHARRWGRALPMPPGPSTVFPALKSEPLHFAAALRSVATRRNAVILIRDPNLQGQIHLRNGHTTKGAEIKAKSSEHGITAGFVAADPSFTKGSQTIRRQAQYVAASLAAGCRQTQIYHTEESLAALIASGAVRRDGAENVGLVRDPAGRSVVVSAQYPLREDRVTFILEWDAREQAYAAFEVPRDGSAYEKPKPVMGLTNILPAGASPQRFDAVCADYDLFGVYPCDAETIAREADMVRQEKVPARLVVPHTPTIRRLADNLLAATGSFPPTRPATLGVTQDGLAARPTLDPDAPGRRDALALRIALRGTLGVQDPRLGNAHPLILDYIRDINAAAKADGFRGGNLCQHSDEIGNPGGDKPGFPIFAVVPDGFADGKSPYEGKVVILKSWAQLLAFDQIARDFGHFVPDASQRWIKPTHPDGKPLVHDTLDGAVLRATSAAAILQIAPGAKIGDIAQFGQLTKSLMTTLKNIDENLLVKTISIRQLDPDPAINRQKQTAVARQITTIAQTLHHAMQATVMLADANRSRDGFNPAYAYRDTLDDAVAVLEEKLDRMIETENPELHAAARRVGDLGAFYANGVRPFAARSGRGYQKPSGGWIHPDIRTPRSQKAAR